MAPLRPGTVASFPSADELVPDRWRTLTTTADDGTELAWIDTGGDGPPVVLLHGIQVDGRSWLRTASALEPRHRVLMPDARGHGRSGRVRTQLTTARMVDDVLTVLASAEVDAPVVIGHSMGADTAGFLAARDARVQALVLVDPALQQFAPPAFDIDDPPLWFAPILDTLRSLRDLPHAERMRAGLSLLPPGVDADWHPTDYVAFVEGQASFDVEVYRHLELPAASLATSPSAVAAIGCPILLLTADAMMPGAAVASAVTALSDHWRDGRHVHMAGAGHHIAADQFDRFVAEVTAFVAP